MGQKILLVEDEEDIGEVIRIQLQSQGHQVDWVNKGQMALTTIQTTHESYDLFILDRMLPEVNGIEICKFIRLFEKTKHTPILMVTALTRPDDVVEGLNAGADDYINKPFDMNVLIARVNALLRRSLTRPIETNAQDQLNLGPIKINLGEYKVFNQKEQLELTRSEFKLLHALIESSGKVLTRKKLVELIQEGPVHVTDRTIDTHIFGLRKKLGEASDLIETIRGVGYRVAATDL